MYESLIRHINKLLEQEKIQKKERFDRGEDFNIFQVMHMESDEVYTHSAILAELLNPKGSHGCKDIFLQLFLDLLPTQFEQPFDTTNAKAEVEVVIGDKTEEEGGRMDVLIHSGKQAIIIENKIYAADQANQLLRYHNYAEQKYGTQNYKLLYLTLDGKHPSDSSTGNNKVKENEDFYCISYANDIKQWILLCLEKAVQKPLVREIMIQYLNLLNSLTYQNMETGVKKELEKLCSEPQNVEALLWIYNNFSSIVQKVMETIFAPQLREIADKNGYVLNIWGEGKDWLNTNYMGFSFKKKEWETFDIAFEFQRKQMRDCVSGYHYRKLELRGTQKETYDALSKLFEGRKSSQGWPSFHYFPKEQNWISEEMMTKIMKGTLKNEIESELLALTKAAEEKGIEL